MAAATDLHWSPAAGSRPPSSSAAAAAASSSSSSSSSWDPWSPPPPPAAGQKPAWTRPSAASTSVDAGSWPALPASSRSPSSVSINPVIGGGGEGESVPSAPSGKPPRDGPGKAAAPEPPAGRSDHGPRPRALAPRGGYGNQRRGNGAGSYNNQGNAYRSRRDSYGHNYHQSQHHVRPPLRPPIFQQPVPFYGPPQIGSYPNVMGFGDAPVHMWYIQVPTLPYHDYVRGSPPPPPQVLSQPHEHLRSAVLQQIEYYFSENNLCKDPFLRRHMDEEGWVPISLIAGFKRMRDLNMPIPFILDTMRNSNVVEVKGNMIRTRIDPQRWPLHPPSSTDIQRSYNNLESQMKSMVLNEGSSSQVKAAYS